MQFEVSGKRYVFDPAPERLMGDELLLLDEHLPEGWANRWASLDLGVRDVMMMTYLAAKRAGDDRSYGEFVRTIAPLTFKVVTDEEPAPAAAPAPAEPLAEVPAPADAIGPRVRQRKRASS